MINRREWEEQAQRVLAVLQEYSPYYPIPGWRIAYRAQVPSNRIQRLVQDLRLAIPETPISSSRRGYWMTFDPNAGEKYRQWRHRTAHTVLLVWWRGEGLPRNRELAKTNPTAAALQAQRVEFVLSELTAAFDGVLS